jgi:Tn3 transposase DDE domain-containing protein
VIAEYTRFELPFLWGGGHAAIADGTHIALLENNLLGAQHVRYGSFGGIAYHHISDTYIALFSHFIACGVWEAVYIPERPAGTLLCGLLSVSRLRRLSGLWLSDVVAARSGLAISDSSRAMAREPLVGLAIRPLSAAVDAVAEKGI